VRQLLEDLGDVDGRRLQLELAGEEAHRLGQAADGIDRDPLDDGGLGGVGRGDEQPGAALGGGGQGHGQRALDRAGLAVEGQLADDGEVAGAVQRHLPAADEHAQGDRQVEAAGVLAQVGGVPG
jgi:hypothetical protein